MDENTLSVTVKRLRDKLEDVAEQYRPTAEGKNLALILEPTGAAARFDPKWTAEAIGNLVDNAVKYTPSGGEVRIRATAFDLFTRIEVADTGIGIPEEEQVKVFARFYRAASVQDTEGVGIGLYLAREDPVFPGRLSEVVLRSRKRQRLLRLPSQRDDVA